MLADMFKDSMTEYQKMLFEELERDNAIEARQERKRDRAEEGRKYRDEGERFEAEQGARE